MHLEKVSKVELQLHCHCCSHVLVTVLSVHLYSVFHTFSTDPVSAASLSLKEGLLPLHGYFGIRPPTTPSHSPCAGFTENSRMQTGQASSTGEVTLTPSRAYDFPHGLRHSHFLLLLILLLLRVRNRSVSCYAGCLLDSLLTCLLYHFGRESCSS